MRGASDPAMCAKMVAHTRKLGNRLVWVRSDHGESSNESFAFGR